jgi:hypothetical protein
MKGNPCNRETEVERALAADRLNDDLRRHVETCPGCGDLALVSQYLRGVARDAASDAPLLDPGLIWWRAMLRERAAAADRATRVISLTRWLGVATGAGLAALGVVRFRHQIMVWLDAIRPSWLAGPVPAGMAPPGLVIVVSLLLIAGLLLLDLYEPRTGE